MAARRWWHSWPAPQLDEIPKTVVRFTSSHALLLVGTAHRPKVTPRACAFCRSRDEKSELDRTIDHFQRLDTSAPALRSQRDRTNLIAAGGSAEEQPRGLDRLPRDRFHCERVEDRLQHAAATDHQGLLRSVLARLVIGHPHRAGGAMFFNEIDRATQDEAPIDPHGIGHAAGIALLVRRQPESKFEKARGPDVTFLGDTVQPASQIASDNGHLLTPYTVDRWRQFLPVLRRNPRHDLIEGGERGPQRSCGNRHGTPSRQIAKQLRLHAVHHAALGERVESL